MPWIWCKMRPENRHHVRNAMVTLHRIPQPGEVPGVSSAWTPATQGRHMLQRSVWCPTRRSRCSTAALRGWCAVRRSRRCAPLAHGVTATGDAHCGRRDGHRCGRGLFCLTCPRAGAVASSHHATRAPQKEHMPRGASRPWLKRARTTSSDHTESVPTCWHSVPHLLLSASLPAAG